MRLKYILAALLSLSAIASASTDPFLEAQDAFRNGQAARLAQAAAKLKKHPLAAYVDYYQLRMRMEAAPAEEISAFIQRHADSYVGDAMRADRLKLLARQGRWAAFEAELPKLVQAADPDLRCLTFEARRQRPDAALAEDARQFWVSVPDLPEACERFFEAAFKTQLLPEKAIWQRAQRQVELGRTALGRKALALLPAKRQPDNRLWTTLTKRPADYLDGIGRERGAAAKPGEIHKELIALAILQLGRQSPDDAARQLSRLSPKLGAGERAALWASVATQAATMHHAKALDWFALADPAAMSDEQHRWRVRAALRAGDFKQVAFAIAAMPAAVAGEPAWIYWQGRALAAAGKPEAAQLLYGRIAGQPNFYGVLATEELGRRISLPPAAAPTSAEAVAQVGEIAAIQRAQAFLKLDLRTEGMREWTWAVRGMNDRQLLAVAEYARRQHIFDRAISAAMQTRDDHDYSLRYLTPYDDTIRPAARKAALDDAWVYGLMRQESRFVNVARSSAGAQGLMQLMPATARWVARRIGWSDYHPGRVTDIGTNVKLGTTYLQLVYESLDRNPVLASAAYNAGPGRARKWRDPVRPLEGAIYAETIPFTETRDYVKNVMANSTFYYAILNGRPDSMKTRLGTIRPASASPPAGLELP